MHFFAKRITPSQNLAFMGVMAGVDAALAVVAAFFPLSTFFIVLFLPLASALVGELCLNKYLWPYAVAASLVALGVTAYDLGSTLFYVIPAILSGTFYGYVSKKSAPVALLIFLTALVELLLNYLSLPLIGGLYQIDMIETAKTILGLENNPEVDTIVPAFIFGFGLAEASLTHFFMQLIPSKVEPEPEENLLFESVAPIAGIFFAVLAFGFAFVLLPIAYLFLSFAIYFAVFSAVALFRRNPWWVYLLLVFLLLLSLYGMAALYLLMPKNSGLLLLSFFLLSADGSSLVSTLLLLRAKKAPLK